MLVWLSLCSKGMCPHLIPVINRVNHISFVSWVFWKYAIVATGGCDITSCLWLWLYSVACCLHDYGCTLLYAVCWTITPNFALIECILKHDHHLLHMKDAWGTTSLAYVHQESWGIWVEFLIDKCDVFWPQWSQSEEELLPPLAMQEPNSRPVSNPSHAWHINLWPWWYQVKSQWRNSVSSAMTFCWMMMVK